MKISKTICFVGAAALAVCALADDTPVVSGVTMSQQSPGRRVTITYQLANAPAVVTLDVQTNYTDGGATKWASIGGAAVCNAKGDVWRKVGTAGATFNGTITWRPDLSWEGHVIASGGARAVVTAWALDNTPNYMAVDISASAGVGKETYYPAADFVPGGVTNGEYKTSVLLMRKIMAKDVTWTMGSTALETQRKTQEAAHRVTLTNNYYIGVYEVTQAQWSLVSTNSAASSNFTSDRQMRPMEKVSYNEIRNTYSTAPTTTTSIPAGPLAVDPSGNSFLDLLRSKTGIDFDLPSEAQWEFAARAGNGDGYWNDGSAILNSDADANLRPLGRFLHNPASNSSNAPAGDIAPSEGGTAVVGSYAPNDWGLYDMHGNVWEWCLDWYEEDISDYDGKLNIDPSVPANTLASTPTPGSARLLRGGSWNYGASLSRPAYRWNTAPTLRSYFIGFRVFCHAGLR